MTTRYAAELRQKASQLIEMLAARSIQAQLLEDSFRDFHVKLDFPGSGVADLYYSPKKDAYTLLTISVHDRALKPQIEQVFAQSQAGSAPQAAATAPAHRAPGRGHVAYVDGSFLDGRTGYGAIILHDGEVVQRLRGRMHHEEEMRQVAGELKAVRAVLDWCGRHGVSEIEIVYDYEGVAAWATGKWKTNKPATRDYAEALRDHPIKIRWRKVKAHAGDPWNRAADALAKAGARLK